MRLCIATFATGAFASICDLTDANKREYAARHGLDFLRNHHDAPSETVFFDRHKWHLQILNSDLWDWVYCLDADAIFTNMKLALSGIIRESDVLIFPLDAVMVQAGGFLVKNCQIAKRFLGDVLARQHYPIEPRQSDQIEMESVIPNYSPFVRFLPQRTLGSYEYGLYSHLGGNYSAAKDREGNDGQWRRGDFVFHVPGATLETKHNVLLQHLALVER